MLHGNKKNEYGNRLTHEHDCSKQVEYKNAPFLGQCHLCQQSTACDQEQHHKLFRIVKHNTTKSNSTQGR